MKADSNKTKALAVAIATMAAATFAWTGCDSHEEGGHTGGDAGHVTAFPICTEITHACHEVDTGDPGPIHDCHETAHGAKAESECSAVKDDCIQICEAAKADAGLTGDGGEHGDAGEHEADSGH